MGIVNYWIFYDGVDIVETAYTVKETKQSYSFKKPTKKSCPANFCQLGPAT